MKLHFYVARQLLVGLIMAVGGMFFIALPGIAMSAVHKLAGVDMSVLLKFLPMVALGLVPYILPIGFLLAVVTTFGRIAADNEWTALRMAGIHPLKIFITPFLLAIVLGGFTFWLMAEPLPKLKRHQKEYLVATVEYVLRNLSPGRTEIEFDPFYLSARYRSGDAFLDAFIHIPSKEGPAKVVRAERVVIGFVGDVMQIKLTNARTFVEGNAARTEQAIFNVRLDELVKGDERKRRRPRYLSSSEIKEELAAGEVTKAKRRSMTFEIQHRMSFAFTFILFLMLGAPTGLILRRGTQLGALAVSVAFAVGYYVLVLRLGKALGADSGVPVYVGAWLTTVLGLVAGVFLMRRALAE